MCDYSSVSPMVLRWRSEGFGGFRRLFLSLLWFVPLHVPILGIRDAAFSHLVLLLWGQGLTIVFLPVSQTSLHSKQFIPLIFALFLGGFLLQLEAREECFPLWEGKVRAGSMFPCATCLGGCGVWLLCQATDLHA